MRYLKNILFLLILTVFLIPSVYAIDTKDKVYDYADLLTDEEEASIQKMAEEYIEKYKLDMVIVLVNDNYSKTTEAYADDFYDYNGFGIGDKKDGSLLLIDTTYSLYGHISTTGEAIRMYDDARIDSLLDTLSYYKYDGYYKMIEEYIEDASNYASDGIPASNKNSYIDENGVIRYKRMFPFLKYFLFSVVLSTVVVVILVLKNRMVKKETRAAAYLDNGSVEYTAREDRFIASHTTHVRVSSNSGGGHGSSGHFGSSGSFHGGGGRHL